MSVNAYLDVGNSRIKVSVGGKPGADLPSETCEWPALTSGSDQTDKALSQSLHSTFSRFGKRKIKRFYLASVVEPARFERLSAALRQLAPQAELVALKVKKRCCRVRTDYAPNQLGIDRFCAVIEAYARAEQHAAIVINCGTAVTVDAVDANGVHQGGVIMPGVLAALKGLENAAPALATPERSNTLQPLSYPNAQFAHSQIGLPLETQSGRVAGMRLLFGAGIEQAILALKAALADDNTAVMISGGDAAKIHELLDPQLKVRVEPNLVLSGLIRIARARR